MTRWARSKNALKHARQPEEATSWTQFRTQRQEAVPSEDASDRAETALLRARGQRGIHRTRNIKEKKTTSNTENMHDHNGAEGGNVARVEEKIQGQKEESGKDVPGKLTKEVTKWNNTEIIKQEENVSNSTIKLSSVEKAEPLDKLPDSPRDIVPQIKEEPRDETEPRVEKAKYKATPKGTKSKVGRKNVQKKLKAKSGAAGSNWTVTDIGEAPLKANCAKRLVEEENHPAEEKRKKHTRVNDISTNKSAKEPDRDLNGVAKKSASKKKKFVAQMRKERESKGMILLPEKVERRIYIMKKAMRQKGIPGEEIKAAVRKVRRKEELLFRKQLEKRCFKCRQPGHRVSECPKMEAAIDEAIGICFKCGSTEHFSSKCLVQTSVANEFPYAKCFICKQVGHLSGKCPQNDKGVYPKGGHCNFCGAIDHFKKDCPQMERNKKKDDGPEVTGEIMDVHGSADAEPVMLDKFTRVAAAKIVTF